MTSSPKWFSSTPWIDRWNGEEGRPYNLNGNLKKFANGRLYNLHPLPLPVAPRLMLFFVPQHTARHRHTFISLGAGEHIIGDLNPRGRKRRHDLVRRLLCANSVCRLDSRLSLTSLLQSAGFGLQTWRSIYEKTILGVLVSGCGMNAL